MQRELKTKEIFWNRVILDAMPECKNSDIDGIFLACEDKFCELNAPEKEIALRLFALAFYCYKTYNLEFSESAVFSRFAGILSVVRFKQTVKALIKKEDPALVVFWAVFRLSFKKTVSQNNYSLLEKKMREKSLELFSTQTPRFQQSLSSF